MCLLVSVNNLEEQIYGLQLCNSIGSPQQEKNIKIKP